MCLVKKTRPLDLLGRGSNEGSLALLPTDVEEDSLSELDTLVNIPTGLDENNFKNMIQCAPCDRRRKF